MENLLDQIVLNHIENSGICIEQMIKGGWQPITPERQPYLFDLYSIIKESLDEHVKVDTPVFKVEGDQLWHVFTRKIPVAFIATDKPEDLPTSEPVVVEEIKKYLKKTKAKYIYQIVVARQPLFGYLPPRVSIFVRMASGN